MMKPLLMLLRMYTPKDKVHLYAHALEEAYNNAVWHDSSDKSLIEVYISNQQKYLDIPALKQEVISLLKSHHLECPDTMSIETIEEKDWVKCTQELAQPVEVGEFYIHGPMHKKEIHKINILLEPGMAFGSGTHPTTKGCLQAMSALEITPKRILDMGCGSGILSVAAAKFFQTFVTAIDNDIFAVSATKANADKNGVTNKINAQHGNGYKAIQSNDSFDLVLCNILAKPLCEMAPLLKNHLAPGGYAILSGLLGNQADEVIAAHKNCNLKLLTTVDIENWLTLVFNHA